MTFLFKIMNAYSSSLFSIYFTLFSMILQNIFFIRNTTFSAYPICYPFRVNSIHSSKIFYIISKPSFLQISSFVIRLSLHGIKIDEIFLASAEANSSWVNLKRHFSISFWINLYFSFKKSNFFWDIALKPSSNVIYLNNFTKMGVSALGISLKSSPRLIFIIFPSAEMLVNSSRLSYSEGSVTD